jgi:hypothetical protein
LFANTTVKGDSSSFESWKSALEPYEEFPLYSEGRNRELWNQYESYARAETVHTKVAGKLLKAVEAARECADAGNWWGAIAHAHLMERYFTQMILSGHEANAITGRLHRARSREGVAQTNQIRRQKSNPKQERNKRIQADYREYAKEKTSREIAGLLAQKHNLSPTQIRRIVFPPKK